MHSTCSLHTGLYTLSPLLLLTLDNNNYNVLTIKESTASGDM